MSQDRIVGIDVHKETLVVGSDDPATPLTNTYPNTPAGRQQVVAALQRQPLQLVVMEASGGYERAILRALWEAAIPVCRMNARQMRDFARATGVLAKTDSLDARVLARAGRQLALTPQPMPSPEQLELAEMEAYRRSLVAQHVAAQNRLAQLTNPMLRASQERLLATLRQERAAIEAEMDRVIASSVPLQAKVAVLTSAPGIGRTSARLLVAALPELGEATGREIAALVGVAPINHDSGAQRGRRRIRGGRPAVRAGLYMAAMAAMRHNPQFSEHAERLRAKGKPGKVIMVAVMRRLLVQLNAMLRDGTPWQMATTVQPA